MRKPWEGVPPPESCTWKVQLCSSVRIQLNNGVFHSASPNRPHFYMNLTMFTALTLTLNYIRSYCCPPLRFVLSPTKREDPNYPSSTYLRLRAMLENTDIPGINRQWSMDWGLLCVWPTGSQEKGL